MPKYKYRLERSICKIQTAIVEAESEEEAMEMAETDKADFEDTINSDVENEWTYEQPIKLKK